MYQFIFIASLCIFGLVVGGCFAYLGYSVVKHSRKQAFDFETRESWKKLKEHRAIDEKVYNELMLKMQKGFLPGSFLRSKPQLTFETVLNHSRTEVNNGEIYNFNDKIAGDKLKITDLDTDTFRMMANSILNVCDLMDEGQYSYESGSITVDSIDDFSITANLRIKKNVTLN